MSTIENAYLNLVKTANKRNLSGDTQKYIPDSYKNVARGMEKQFAEFMLEQMNKTTGEAESSSGMEYYKSLQTDERAKGLTEKDGGLGLQRVILDQIYPQRFRNEQAFAQYKKQTGNNFSKPKVERHDHPTIEMAKGNKEPSYE